MERKSSSKIPNVVAPTTPDSSIVQDTSTSRGYRMAYCVENSTNRKANTKLKGQKLVSHTTMPRQQETTKQEMPETSNEDTFLKNLPTTADKNSK